MTNRLQLTLCCGDYDITRALVNGTVTPDGIDLITMTMPSPERHWRMIKYLEFDVCEFSMCQYLVSKSNQAPLAAIPVFPHRRFRHSYIFVNSDAGIRHPKDLEGRRVGLRTLQNTAGLWIRGMFQHYYQADISKIEWVTQNREPVSAASASSLEPQQVPPGDSIDAMLVRGDLAAAIYPDILPSFSQGDKAVKRLFADPMAEELRYFKDTGFFPIMHTVVLKQSIVERYPWVARSLQIAFQKAKEICYRRMEDPRKTALAMALHHWEEQKQLMGTDPWSYGLEVNRENLKAMIGYAHEQGLIPQPLALSELFIESAAARSPRYLVKLD